MTRKRIPCTLSSRVIGPSSHSGSLGRVRTLGKIRPMAFFFVHGKCQHYYESGHSSGFFLNVLADPIDHPRPLMLTCSGAIKRTSLSPEVERRVLVVDDLAF